MSDKHVPATLIECRVLASQAKLMIDKAKRMLERGINNGTIEVHPERNIDIAAETAYSSAVRLAGELRHIERDHRYASDD